MTRPVYIFNHVVSLGYTQFMLYILKGGQVYHVPPCLPQSIPYMHSQVVSSCLVGLSFVYLCRLWPSALVGLRSWRRLKVLLGLGVQQRAYLNKMILAPSSHCGRWTLILCAGALFILFISPFLDLFMLLVVLSHAYINA